MSRLPKGRPHRRRSRGRRVLILTNGRVTEPEYLAHLVGELGLGGLVTVSAHEAGRDPLTLVRAAAKEMDRDRREARREGFDPYASVWAVTDVDQYDVGPAQREARENGVRLAVSNPCFEVWLIDHVKPCPEACFETRRCQEEAVRCGVTTSTGAGRSSRSRMKGVRIDAVEGRVCAALENAALHNTDEKRSCRLSRPGDSARYAVWTDVPELVSDLRECAGDVGRGPRGR